MPRDLNVTEDDLIEARELAAHMSTEDVRKVKPTHTDASTAPGRMLTHHSQLMANVLRIHERDPNFPHTILERIQAFLENDDVFASPEKHEALITEMKLEAALITNNSPYAEVRAVVDNKDDPATPCSTVRAWTIGVLFSVFLAFINQLFSIRLPTILISANVAQLLAFPLGKAWERWVPSWEFRVMGQTHNINPGRFNSNTPLVALMMWT